MPPLAVFGVLAALASCGAALGGAPPLFAPAPGSPIALRRGPNDIVAADLSGDGFLDLVTTSGRTSDVSLLLGDGQGGFRPAPGPPLTTPVPPHLVAVGDLNGDGAPDLAATAHDSFDAYLWLGDGRGGFRPAPGSPRPALEGQRPHNHGLALADLDADGHLDVATTDDVAHAVAVLLGDGTGALRRAPGSPFAVGGQEPYPLALGDLDGNGRPDIVTPNVGSASVSVLLGDGRGGFAVAAGGPVRVAARPFFVALGDLDGDRRVDAVVTHDDSEEVTLLFGDGDGGLKPPAAPTGKPRSLEAGRRLWKAVLHDVDGNGTLDLLAAGGAVVAWLGDGKGRFEPAPGSPYPCGRGAWSLAVADFNRDGRPDVATADLEAETVTVLLGRARAPGRGDERR